MTAVERRQVKADLAAGAKAYEGWREKILADPVARAIYEEESAKKEVWLQLVEARTDAGLTQAQLAKRLGVSQAQVARVEKRGYDAYTLKTLRRYVEAIGNGLSVKISIVPGEAPGAPRAGKRPVRRAVKRAS